MRLGRRIASLLVLSATFLASLAGDVVGHKAGHATGGEPRRAATDQQLAWLIENHGLTVFRVAFAVTRHEALAEEVVQDTIFRAWTSMPSWEGDVPVRWLRTVARNRAISVMRQEARAQADDDLAARRSTEPDLERVVEGRALVEAMRVALAGLDETARTMIVLRETEELGYDEIAELLDLTPSAVKAKLYRARHQLKKTLEDWDL